MNNAYRTLWPFKIDGTWIPKDTFVQFDEGTAATDYEGYWRFQITQEDGRLFGLTVLDRLSPHREQIGRAMQAGAFEQLRLTPPHTSVTIWEHLLREDSTWDTV